MVSATLINNVRTMNRRYKRHLESGDHVLRGISQPDIAHASVEYFNETDITTKELHTEGGIVAPGGLGKTIDGGEKLVGYNTTLSGRYVLGDPALGKRGLITAPNNTLVDQWGDRLLGERDEETGLRGPSIFGDRFTEDTVGVYHAKLPPRVKNEILKKPIVIITPDSLRALHGHINPKTLKIDPLIRLEDFAVVLADEEDEKLRGDVTGKFYKDEVIPKCMFIGYTATPVLRDGHTIGDYLHGGKKPICQITHREAVERREIAPHINIIVRRAINPASVINCEYDRWGDYSEKQKLWFIEQTGSDNAMLDVIRVGHHPKTEQPLSEMRLMYGAVNVEHVKYFAKRLNDRYGKRHAGVVWGKMDPEQYKDTKAAFKEGYLTSIVQCKLWGRGTDWDFLQGTVQLAPSLSPGKIIQFHTRASRLFDGKKCALYISPFIDGIDQLVAGELLDGLYMIPDGYEFPPTAGKENHPSNPKPWPKIEGIEVYHTEQQLEMFASERRRQRYVNGLPTKSKDMLNLEEMSKALGIDDPNLLQERVYKPLQTAFEERQAREKYVDIPSVGKEDFLHVRGKMFPVFRGNELLIGFFQHKTQEVFCVNQDLVPLCEHTLYGRLDSAPFESLDKSNSKRLLGCNNEQIDTLWQNL